MTGPPSALPDPEHGGSHHESDEAPLLIRELRPLKQTQQDGGGAAGSNGGSAGAASSAQPLGDVADGGGAAGGGSNGAPGGAPSSRFQVMGLDVTPELVAIAMVYFVQGILGLSRLAISFYFKDDLHVDPAEVAVLTGIAGMPWVIKPLYGFISDAIPLWGYRRRSYLAVCGLLGAASWTALATVTSTPAGAVAAMTLGALSTAASDVVVDSIVVERSRGAPEGTTGSLQSLCWASSAVGGIASSYFSGSLVQAWGTRPVFAATGLFPLFVSFAAFLIDEQRVTAASPGDASGVHARAAAGSGGSSSRGVAAAAGAAAAGAAAAAAGGQAEGDGIFLPVAAAGGSSSSSVVGGAQALAKRMRAQVVALWGAVRQPGIFLPTVFVFLWQATPTNDSAMFYFYTNHLHFTPEFLGRVRLAGSVASLAGVALYNSVFKKVPLKRMFFWAMVLGTALGSTQLLLVSGANRALGLSDELFVLGDSVILTVIGQVSFMPVLVLAARLCPEGVEATLFATLMSILNGGAFVGSAVGAGLTAALGVTSTNFDHLFALTAVCTFSTLAPMPFLGLLPAAVDRDGPGGDGKRDHGFGAGGAGGEGGEDEEGIALLERGGGGGGGGGGNGSGSGREPHLRRPRSGDVES